MTDYHLDENVVTEMLLTREEARTLLDCRDARTGRAARAAVSLLDGSAGEDGRRRVAAALDGTDHVLSCGIHLLLEHRGIDPDAAMALASAAGGSILILDGERRDMARGDRPLAQVAVSRGSRLPSGRCWFSPAAGLLWTDAHLRAPIAPETLMMSRVGRPLSDWISHPALDRLRATVVGYEPSPNDRRLVHIVTDLHVRGDDRDD